MANTKQQHYGNVSPAPHSPASLPSPSSHLFRQLRHDLAKLSDRDPDTRRSSMESLKGFIEEQLDARNIPSFVDQVSGDRGAIAGAGPGGGNGGGGTFAISLFVEVARVHKQNTIPFIPRIMSSIIRSLSTSSAGSMNNLHQSCSKVVSAVARYAIEAPPSSSPALSSCAEVLYGIAQPLLGHLFSNVEPVAVGSATCLQALIEAENWKYATPDLVSDVCYKSSVCLVEKCKFTVAHLGLLKSLAKFNSAGLQDYASSLLKVAINVLSMKPVTGTGTPQRLTSSSSWQQRVSAAQLIAALLSSLDPRILASELVPTTQALEGCKFDKNATIRQAVGEALSIAKSMTPQLDPLLLQDNGFDESLLLSTPPRSRPPDPRRRSNRKKSLWRSEESSGSTSSFDDIVVGSQESHMLSYSPGSVTALSMNSPGSTACSAVKIGRSPLFPAKQSPVISSSVDRYNADAELQFLLSHRKSLDSKENAPFVGKSVDVILSAKPEDLGLALFNNVTKASKETGTNTELTGNVCNQTSNAENERNSFLFELIGDTKQILEDGLCKENLPSSEDWLSSKALDEICERELCQNDVKIEDVIIGSHCQNFSNEDKNILDQHKNIIDQHQNILDEHQNMLDQKQNKNVSVHQSQANMSGNLDFECKRDGVSAHQSLEHMSDNLDFATKRNGVSTHQSLADISDNLEFVTERNDISSHQSLADISDNVNFGTRGEEKNIDLDTQTCITSVTTVDNSHQEDACSQQAVKKRMTSEDFLIFSTPRRLVRRLQSVTSTPDSKCVVDNQVVDFDFETLSESGWSVRDNPIAGGESEDESPRDNSVVMKSMESPLLKRSFSQGSTITQVEDEKNFTFSTSADNTDSSLRASLRTDFSRTQLDVFGYDRHHDHDMKMEDDNCFDCMDDCNITSMEMSEANLVPKQLFGSSLGEMSQLSWTNFGRKIHRCAEMSLILALLFVLLFTAVVAVLNCISGQDDELHTLVPT